MILWNLISLILVIATLVEARKNDWRFPKFNSIATITFMWFIASLALHILNGSK